MTDTAGFAQAGQPIWSQSGTELEMDDTQFSEWTRLLKHRAGLFIGPDRRSFLLSGIRARMRENRCQTLREYYDRLLKTGTGEAEWLLLVDRLTVHETRFFRHRSSMQLVGESLVPEALESGAGYRAWSVGCATGEEAFSLAMQVEACVAGQKAAVQWCVIGSDISLPSLHHARDGRYLNRSLRDIPEAFRENYCCEVSASHFEIAPGLRERVSFVHMNLRDLGKCSMEPVDLIYCQNLLIYYDRRKRVEMIDKLVEFLRPGGALVLGPGDVLDWRHAGMARIRCPDTLAYRRKQD